MRTMLAESRIRPIKIEPDVPQRLEMVDWSLQARRPTQRRAISRSGME
jgi:hypothetical protein